MQIINQHEKELLFITILLIFVCGIVISRKIKYNVRKRNKRTGLYVEPFLRNALSNEIH